MTPEVLAQLIGERSDMAALEARGGVWLAIGARAIDALAPRADRPRAGLVVPPDAAVEHAFDIHDAIDRLAGGAPIAAILLDARLLQDRPLAALRELTQLSGGAAIVLCGEPPTRAARKAARTFDVPVWDPHAAPRSALADAPRPPTRTPPPDRKRARRSDRKAKSSPNEAFLDGCLRRLTRPDALKQYVLDSLTGISGAERASLMLRDTGRATLLLQAVHGMRDDLVGKVRQSVGAGIAGRVAALGRPTVGRATPGGVRRYDGAAYVVLPLGRGRACQGVVNLTNLPGDRLPETDRVRMWETMCRRAGLALRHALRLRQAENLSTQDQLTQLPNRRAFERALAREIERARRDGTRLGVALLDVDHFKSLNDDLGHQAGDRALTAIARRMDEAFRETDLVCRWGGEEFAVLLPGLGADAAGEALGAIERARRAVATRPLDLGPDVPARRVTVSGGLAIFPDAAGESEALLRLADEALYAAKEGGRNRIQIA
ncbi:MAG: sensor domain-containing diguanylate cyclase [Planctomycetota bacterium]|nr:sensor domain-containing diguanylate cyclase [Planctomycetota bacterium]